MPEGISLDNEFLEVHLVGRDAKGNPQTIKVRGDRVVEVWDKLVALQNGREQIIKADDSGLLRVRPFESCLPIKAGAIPTSTTTMYTLSGIRGRFYFEFCNVVGLAARYATLTIETGTSSHRVIETTEIEPGSPTRLGFYDLDDGWYITASASHASAIHLHILADQFNATGDTP